jgi:hypothetical protein
MKRLINAVVHGFGLAAGKKLFDDALEDFGGESPPAKSAEELAADEKRAAKARAQEDKQRAARAKRDAKERASAAKKAAAEVDDELAALKKRLGK